MPGTTDKPADSAPTNGPPAAPNSDEQETPAPENPPSENSTEPATPPTSNEPAQAPPADAPAAPAPQESTVPVDLRNGTGEESQTSSGGDMQVVSMNDEDCIAMINKLGAFPSLPSVPSSNHSGNTAIRVTVSEMEVTELKVKIICQEKNILALQMELKASELQLEAKNKIDVKKTRLVELLDAKLVAVEKRNIKLLEMLEQMLKDKDGNSTRLKDATKNMQDLSQRLVDSERIKSELLRMNAELKTMLQNIETKGTQIAKLAKEKVLKYKDENVLMQQELTDLKVEAAAAAVENAEGVKQAAEAAAAVVAAEGAKQAAEALPVNEELWCKISELQGQISSALHSVDSSKLEGLQRSLIDASEANEALRVSVEEARVKTGEGLSALSVENDQLRALVEEFDVTRKKLEKKDALNRDQLLEQKNCVTEKDKEIVELKDELSRLKGAIGQLIGGAK